jgi:hypothetical protein
MLLTDLILHYYYSVLGVLFTMELYCTPKVNTQLLITVSNSSNTRTTPKLQSVALRTQRVRPISSDSRTQLRRLSPNFSLIYRTAISIVTSSFELLYYYGNATNPLLRYYGNATGCIDHVTKET